MNVRNTQTFNQFFPLARFTACQGQYEPPKVDNTFHTFSAGGLDWLVITAELDPRPGALAWFNQVVTEHPDHNVIYVTHNYLAPSGNLAGPVGYGDLSPQAIWDGLIKLHANIRFVLSGHLTQTALRQTPGNSGKPVYQILTDYQDVGEGWLRTLEIDPQAKTVKSEVYSPYLRQSKTGPTEQFTLQNVELVPKKLVPDAGVDAGVGGDGAAGSAGAGVGGTGAAGSAGTPGSGGSGGVDPGTGGSSGGGNGGSTQGTGGVSATGGSGPDASAGSGASGRAPLAGGGAEESGCGCRLADTRQQAAGLSLLALLFAAFRIRRRASRARS